MKIPLIRLAAAIGAIACSASFAFPATAMTVRGDETFVLPAGETLNDDLYIGSGQVILNGNVNGDVYAVGGTVVVNGAVSQDVVAAGGNMTIAGTVGDDLRVAGGNVSIMGNVKGDVIAAGGNMLVSRDATFGQDLVVGAGSLVFEGHVKRAALLSGGSIMINGTIDGPVEIRADEVRFGSEARIAFKARVFAPKEALVDTGAKLSDGMEYTKMTAPAEGLSEGDAKKFVGPFLGFLTMIFVLKIVGLMIAAGVLASVFNSYSNKVVDRTLEKPGRALFAGFAMFFLTPIAILILVVTIVGSWLGALLGLGFAFLIAMAKVYAGIVFGAWLWRLGTKNKTRGVDWKAAIVGAFLLSFLGLIPILGWILLALAFLFALGGLYAVTEERLKAMR